MWIENIRLEKRLPSPARICRARGKKLLEVGLGVRRKNSGSAIPSVGTELPLGRSQHPFGTLKITIPPMTKIGRDLAP